MKTIQEQIEQIRKDKGFKQSYVANRLGISQSTYSQYFTRNADIRFSLVSQICDILGITIVDAITYPIKYVPIDEAPKECPECRKKDLIIENLNNYIEILKNQRK